MKIKTVNMWHATGLGTPPHESLGTARPEGCKGRLVRGRMLFHPVISSD